MNIYGTDGTDFLYGTSSSDMLVGLGGADYLYGGDGEDLFIGGAGPDVMYGNSAYFHGTDRDMAAYWDSPTGVAVDLATGLGYRGTAEGDILIDIEGVRGSYFNDYLTGNALGNSFDGSDGHDYLIGYGGDDDLTGGYGDDLLAPGSGVDIANGGWGNDTVDYNWGSPSGVWASLLFGGGYTGDAAGDTYYSIENLSGTHSGDYLQGDNFGNVLTGNSGNDWLWGEGGDDTLVGGWGIDTLVGGAGADTFIWAEPGETGATMAAADLISDFDPTFDLIDLRPIDADLKMPGNQAFEFIGMADFTAPGQVRWSIEGSETVVWINRDWDLAADEAIRLAGAPLLGIDNFLL